MENSILVDIVATLQRLFVGYIPAVILGIFVGFIIGINGIVYQLFSRLFQIPNSIPSIAFLPIALILFKENETAAIFVVFVGVLWAIIVETATGIHKSRQQDNNSRVAIYYIFKALRLGMWIAWFTVIATEMLAGSKGLGFLVWNGYKANNPRYIIDALLYIAVIGVFLDQLLDLTGSVLYKIVGEKSKSSKSE
ncbi:nitrate transporter [Anabaena aphanizomenioides LEGE 00250]|jgi:NitT/TauT family transport system permease protein|uniref:Nitrate transporter n=1 Tax=Sphaerospermopsis aphanizomenoides LEGE 00250 TaxID=2777972 RepID=A0ABR9V989_9CYAN|nr:ABC transporter permease subunit [Sphaerospermopsis aphanizomenoides]MBE9235053.1 nitrate transporter [Sphaerospermopsis aphanizomenoides LEGE 00250]